MKYYHQIISAFIISTMLSGCASTLDRLEQIGKTPELTKVENPQAKPDYKPMSWPLPTPTPPTKQYANSLWQPGARAFFRDFRAARVGDILKVRIKINDVAQFNTQTIKRRDNIDTVEAPSFFGLETEVDNVLPGSPDPSELLDIASRNNMLGFGNFRRQDRIATEIPAVITQVLPNGNFVIAGSQEIRVSQEIRELGVSGIVRPEDIDSTNTVDSTQVAEARIVYGGRGQLNEAHQPRWGSQALEILAPF